MHYVKLGQSGLRTSKIVLGCMSYGASTWQDWVLDEKESLKVMKAAYEAGINTFDSANMYSNGQSEELIAKFMEKNNVPREKLTIMTKCYFGTDEDKHAAFDPPVSRRAEDAAYANATGLSRTAIFNQVNASLERLNTGYIDLLWSASSSAYTFCDPADYVALSSPLRQRCAQGETMRALHDLVQSGKVRYIGASSMWTWEFATYQFVAERNGWTKFVAMQNKFSALYREEEREMIPFCKETGIGLVPWFSLNSGRLARPVSQQDQSTRKEFTKNMLGEMGSADEEIIDRVEQVAKRMKLTMAQVAFLWVAQQVDATLLGINKIERVQEFVDALAYELSEEDSNFISEPYQPQRVVGHR